MKYPLGICLSPESARPLSLGAFDFLEVNVQQFLMPEAPASAFEQQLELARACAWPVRAANCFLPGDLKCVGESVDGARLLAYAKTAFQRAAQAGIETIVFGSGAARRAPEGYDIARAFDDYVAVLRQLGPLAEKSGVTLVVEPLNRSESNIVNSVAEGAEAVERCGHPSIRLLADSFHMMVESEPASEIVRFGKWIHHVHFAELEGRAFPGKHREDFRPFFDALAQINYQGRIALECAWDDIATDLVTSAHYLAEQLEPE